MKTRSRKLLSLLLALTLLLSLVPGTALALDDIPINGPSSIKINGTGTYSMPTSVSGMTIAYKSYSWAVGSDFERYISIVGSTTSPTCTVRGKSAGYVYLYCYTTDVTGVQRRSRIGINVTTADNTTSDGATMNMSPTSVTAYVGDTFTLTGTVSNSSQSSYKFDWTITESGIVHLTNQSDTAKSSTTTWSADHPGTLTIYCSELKTSGGEVLSGRVAVTVREKQEDTSSNVPQVTKPSRVPTPSSTWTPLTVSVENAQSGDDVYWQNDCGLLLHTSIPDASYSAYEAVTPISNGSATVYMRLSGNSSKSSGTITATVRRGGDNLSKTEIPVTLPDTTTAPDLTVTPSSLSLSTTGSNTSGTFTASVPSATANLSDYSVRWSSDNKEVAYFGTGNDYSTTRFTSSSTGSVTVYAGKAGTTTIRARLYRGDTAVGSELTRTVTVTAPTASLTVSHSTGLNLANSTSHGSLTASIPAASYQDGYYIYWTSSNPDVAYFNSAGKDHTETTFSSTAVSGSYTSDVTIYAGSGSAGKSATITAQLYRGNTIVGNPITRTVTVGSTSTVLSLSSSLSLNTSGTGSFTATLPASVEGSRSEYTIYWTSSNANVAYFPSSISTSAGNRYAETTFSTTASGSSYTSSATIYAGTSTGTATITAQLYRGNSKIGDPITRTVTVGNSSGLSLSLSRKYPTSSTPSLSYNSSASSRTFEVTPSVTYNGSSVSTSNSNLGLSYDWSLRNNSSSGKEIGSSRRATYTVDADDLDYYSTLYLSCTVTASYTGATSVSRTISWTINGSSSSKKDFSVSATVYSDTKSYYLGEKDDYNKTSIIDQIEDSLGSKEYIDYIRFSDVSTTYGKLSASTSRDYYYENRSSSRYDLEDVYFTPSKTGTASFDCTVYTTKDYYYYCTVNIKVVSSGSSSSSSSSGDIEYSAKSGNSVDFKVRDFENWWDDLYPNGELEYVTFSSPSRGTIYEDYSSSRDTGDKITSSTKCYADPSRTQTDLDDLTFVPSSSNSTDVTISFTAYGYDRNDKSRSEKGTIYIDYGESSTSKTAKDISYKTTGTNGVNLSASDFTSVYRDVMSTTATSSMTIRFTSVPSSGTLSYEPSSGRSVTLTSSNIRSYDFSSSGTYRISDVVYTPKSNTNISSDKISYDCYSGSTRRFSGSVVFSSTAVQTVTNNVTINYSTTGSNVTFNASDFYNKSALLSASYLTFGSPSSGTLYSGSAVATTGTKYSYVASSGNQFIGNLSYHPAANYNGTASIPFTAYNANGTQAATGTVNIQVATGTPSTTPTTPSTTPSTTKTFSDVPSGAWYYSDVSALAAAGIVAGRNDGKFYPQDTVNYGEALKLILLAAGAPKQEELPNASWAANYLNYAVSNGILSGSAADYSLSAAINRDNIAAMAAKALKLGQATGTSPYADTSDGYVLALTNAGIVQGDDSSGTRLWKGSSFLTRAEISTIVNKIYKYRNVTHGASSTHAPTVDTNKHDWLK